jgi:acyl-coenzyme A synthetase/AMP-(fatty) acid ligase
VSDILEPALAVADRSGSWTYDDLAVDQFCWRGQVPAGGVAAVQTESAVLVARALTVLEGWAADVHLLPADVPPPADAIVMTFDPIDSPDVITGDAAVAGGTGTGWWLYTSGTTGAPKPVRHTQESLARTIRSSSRASDLSWGLVYDPNRMAGMQVLLPGLRTRRPVFDAGIHDSLADRAAWLASRGVNALSATPTLWRQLLQTDAASGWALRQITLGGEIADQRILTALRGAFPEAHITHVFASTETGAAFAVGDGREGFPLAYLTEAPRGVRLEIRDGILHVYSPGVSTAGPDGFASTGDVVEVIDDRVLFRGRDSGMVNVGGSKVWPEQVEAALREHPLVQDVVVSAKANAFSGQILVATVQVSDASEAIAVGRVIRSWAKERLTGAMVPASIKVVESLTGTATGKAARS